MSEQPQQRATGSALEDFYAAIGQPLPEPLSDEEKAAFDRRQDEVDEAIERRRERRAA